jgi:hypothetical protein
MIAIYHLTLLYKTCPGFNPDVCTILRYYGYELKAVLIAVRSSINSISRLGPVIRLLDLGSLFLLHFD